MDIDTGQLSKFDNYVYTTLIYKMTIMYLVIIWI